MTDGTISTILSLVVCVLATSLAAVVVSRTRKRERRRAAEHETMALRDAGLRAEVELLESQVWNLRTQIANLQGQRPDVVALVQAASSGSDPSSAIARGALRPAHARTHDELSRRLERAGDARVIPFPFLADAED